MIALQTAHGKDFLKATDGSKTGKNNKWAITNSLKAPTITPYFGQSPVTLGWDKATVASRPGPVRAPDSSAPQPPGVHSAGPVEFAYAFNPLMPSGRLNAGPIFFAVRATSMLAVGCTLGYAEDGIARHFARGRRDAEHQRLGLVATPLCTTTVEPVDVLERIIARLASSASGTLKVSALPLQSPSLTQRRTTL